MKIWNSILATGWIIALFFVSIPGMAQLLRFNERPVDLSTQTGQIKGKMILPGSGENYPVVLLIAGSGPTDMDGNSVPAQMRNNSLKYLAEGLARRGIATVRFDKRGIAASAAAGKDEYSLRFEDYVKDVEGWIDLLARDKRFKGVYVAGHSEGSLLGILALGNKQKVKGFISIAGSGRPMDELLKEQLAGQPEVIRTMAKSICDSLKAGKLVPNVPLGMQALFRPSVQPFLISCFKYNPQEEIKKLKMPVLIVQGKTDIQVSEKDAELLKKALPAARLELIGNMNHVLKECATLDRQKQMAVYMDPDLPVHPLLLSSIEKFVKQ